MITIVIEKTTDGFTLNRTLRALLNTDISLVDKILIYQPGDYPIPKELKQEVTCIENLTEEDCISDYLVFIDPTSVLSHKDWIAKLTDGLLQGEFACSAGRNRSAPMDVAYGSAMSVDPLYYLDLTPITIRPSDRSAVSVPTGPIRIINSRWYWKIKKPMADIHPLFRDHVFALLAWNSGALCRVVPDLCIVHDPVQINPHPYEYYSNKFSLMRRLGISEPFIKTCVSESPIIQNAYSLSLEESHEPISGFDVVSPNVLHSEIVGIHNVSFNQYKWNVPIPNMPKRVANAKKSMELVTKRLMNDPKNVVASKETRDKRFNICNSCMVRSNNLCRECGCFVGAKIALATEACPLSPPLWLSV